MSENRKRTRIETEAIVIGYAMSRLDVEYLIARKCSTWAQAYEEAANAMTKPSTTFDNLRDEFDPVHPNPRKGWHMRELRPNRQRVLDELKDVSDEALLELINRIIARDDSATGTAIDSMAVVNKVAYNVAERLLTGRRAEEFFLENSDPLIDVPATKIVDMRHMACGYDFSVTDNTDWAIEIKGIKSSKGSIQFTDREWTEAKFRSNNYWLIVVGNLANNPIARVFRNPHQNLTVNSSFRQTVTVDWHTYVSVVSGFKG